MNLKESRVWMNQCPSWCNGIHLNGPVFAGTHMQVQKLRPAPEKFPGSTPQVVWTKETLLIAGVTYMVCMSSECGRALLVIEHNESIEDFESRVLVAIPRIKHIFETKDLVEHDLEDIYEYAQGY